MRLRDVFQCEQRLTFSPEGETTERHLRSTVKSYGCAVTAKRIGCEVYVMKKNRLLGLIGTAVVGLCSTAWAGPHGGGGVLVVAATLVEAVLGAPHFTQLRRGAGRF